MTLQDYFIFQIPNFLLNSLCPFNCTDSIQSTFLCDLCLAQEDVQCGAGQSMAANTHWREWTAFVHSLGIDPFLKAVQSKIQVLQVFIHQNRSGTSSASRDPVQSCTAEYCLQSIGQTFLAVGKGILG